MAVRPEVQTQTPEAGVPVEVGEVVRRRRLIRALERPEELEELLIDPEGTARRYDVALTEREVGAVQRVGRYLSEWEQRSGRGRWLEALRERGRREARLQESLEEAADRAVRERIAEEILEDLPEAIRLVADRFGPEALVRPEPLDEDLPAAIRPIRRVVRRIVRNVIRELDREITELVIREGARARPGPETDALSRGRILAELRRELVGAVNRGVEDAVERLIVAPERRPLDDFVPRRPVEARVPFHRLASRSGGGREAPRELLRVEHDEDPADSAILDQQGHDVVDDAVDEGDDPGPSVHGGEPELGAGRRLGGEPREEAGDVACADHRAPCRGDAAAAVGAGDHVLREDSEEPLDIPLAGGEEEAGEEAVVHRGVGGSRSAFGVEALAGAPVDLAAVRLGLPDHFGDLAVAEAERFPEDEDGALDRAEPFEEEEERGREVVGAVVVASGVAGQVDERILDEGFGEPGSDVLETSGPGRFQGVDAEACDEAHQVGARVVDRRVVDRVPADVGVLEHVLGLADGAEHSVGDAEEARSLALERFERGVGRVVDPSTLPHGFLRCHESSPLPRRISGGAELPIPVARRGCRRGSNRSNGHGRKI